MIHKIWLVWSLAYGQRSSKERWLLTLGLAALPWLMALILLQHWQGSLAGEQQSLQRQQQLHSLQASLMQINQQLAQQPKSEAWVLQALDNQSLQQWPLALAGTSQQLRLNRLESAQAQLSFMSLSSAEAIQTWLPMLEQWAGYSHWRQFDLNFLQSPEQTHTGSGGINVRLELDVSPAGQEVIDEQQ